jgi:ribosome-associated protein
MDIKRLQALVVDALEDVKAQEIAVFDTTHLTALFDRVAIASGTSNRQTKALAASVRDKVKSNGGQVVSVEGEDTGEWVLVDLGDMIVHIMQPAIRAYYRLEEIWGDKAIKLADAKRGLNAKASAEDGESKPRRRAAITRNVDSEAPAPKRARKTAAATEEAAPRRATKTASKTASKTAPKPASKTAAKTAVKGAAGKTAAPRKSAAKKSAAKTPAGKTIKVAASNTASARPARKAATSR